MHTDIAPNSLSTLMNSHGSSLPSFANSPSASTMWVCGEMGYAQTTSGRQSATASATAREPSICLRMGGLLQLRDHFRVRRARGRDVRARELLAEGLRDGGGHRVERDLAREGGEGAEQCR